MKTVKNLTLVLLLFFAAFTHGTAQVQDVKLTQIKGAFEAEQLTLAPGQYQFEIANKDVGHDVGFVLVPKGKYDATDHIKEAYVKSPVATGTSSQTNVVNLEAGEYEYFCPLNPTPKYTLVVTDKMRKEKKKDKMKKTAKADKMND